MRERRRAFRKACVPPVKLIARGKINNDIIAILAANSRVPQSNYGDLVGQLNALDLGERRLKALLDDYGEGVVAEALGAFTRRAETLMRAKSARCRMAPSVSTTISTTTASPTSR